MAIVQELYFMFFFKSLDIALHTDWTHYIKNQYILKGLCSYQSLWV